jgi:hypothetical protein
MSKARDKLAAEILRNVPQQHILTAAAALLLHHKPLDNPTMGQVVGYIETLDVRGLKLLRKIALGLEERFAQDELTEHLEKGGKLS